MSTAQTWWLTNGKLITPRGIARGAVGIRGGRLAHVGAAPSHGDERIDARGYYVAPGFIDLHVWGEPEALSRELVTHGTTAFLVAVGPAAPREMRERLAALRRQRSDAGARCLGAHLEGPFLNPRRAGALPARWMRRPSVMELRQIVRAGRARLMTIAPELPGALAVIRWCRRRRIVVSLGHSQAEAPGALRAVEAGARAVTHVFNGMPPLHHRRPSVLDVALTDPRLITMAIADGIHLSPLAFRLLVRAKGQERIALVTDSIRWQRGGAVARGGAFFTRAGVLAGSDLTMMRALHNAMAFAGLSLWEAVRMATEVPAHVLGLWHERGSLEVGKRADLVVFDSQFHTSMTIVGGEIVYQRRR
ncbi:MAG: amidohydrolase family protein [Candidatus Omnitrophota bacterium]|nr:amidohydrolase family protein [Candidatus Omnitrophota bacterium]